MAKDKKRGFFSWLGFGQQEENQQQPEPAAEQGEHQATDTVVAPKLDDKLPAQESAPAESKDTPGEWDASLNGEPIAENIPVLVEHSVVVEQPAEEIAPLIEPVAEVVEPEPQPAPEPLATTAEIETPADIPELQAPAVTQEQERPSKEGFFARLKRSLLKTKQNLGSGFIGLFRGKKIDDDLFEELEEQLLIADVGVETTRKIIESLTQHASRKQLKDAEALYGKLKEEMSGILAKVDQPLDVSGKTPFVILMVGVNGVGKTTTIGKLARQFQAEGKSVMLAAGDTFRAAAVEQLQVWGERNRIPVVAQHTGADSASVIFDAVQAAKARNIDVLIADTAGRLQNKAHLMEELKKIVRVMKKLDEQAPHEVMLTLDASTGQNAVSQAKLFNEAVGLTGITLTKLDGTAKGGVIFSIADQFTIPIRYIGVGEGIEDLRPFKADDFIEALFARED
ncbi:MULTISPECIES: signal recognition particle-docking protein FtsY [unclassified Serratia (in: enterobacteria)]|uniref:signal recognition particle-docking protein FtsY n=1 Tax=unclassified Serratia (in: enterobacteria) TaxID=2647522 RepID=UPI00307655FE